MADFKNCNELTEKEIVEATRRDLEFAADKSSDQDKISRDKNLAELYPLPKSITDEFPGGVINIGIHASSGLIVELFYPWSPNFSEFPCQK